MYKDKGESKVQSKNGKQAETTARNHTIHVRGQRGKRNKLVVHRELQPNREDARRGGLYLSVFQASPLSVASQVLSEVCSRSQ